MAEQASSTDGGTDAKLVSLKDEMFRGKNISLISGGALSLAI